MGVPIQRVNTIINGKRGITAETAILLSEALNTSPEFWMGLQANHDLRHMERNEPGEGRSRTRVTLYRFAPRRSSPAPLTMVIPASTSAAPPAKEKVIGSLRTSTPKVTPKIGVMKENTERRIGRTTRVFESDKGSSVKQPGLDREGRLPIRRTFSRYVRPGKG
jgi:plasmid maintenance system antidote protein VapI